MAGQCAKMGVPVMTIKAVGRILLACLILITAADTALAKKPPKGGDSGGGTTEPAPEPTPPPPKPSVRYLIQEIVSPVGGPVSLVHDINNADTIVGAYRVEDPAAPNINRGFIWHPLTGSVDLNDLLAREFKGWYIASARGINDEGVIVCSAFAPGASDYQPCILRPQENDGTYTVVPLGVPAGAEWSRARFINNRGDIVIQTRYPPGQFVFELWLNDPTPTLINLTNRIPNLRDITGLNNSGEVVASISATDFTRTARYTPETDALLYVADFINNPRSVLAAGINDFGDMAISFNHPGNRKDGTALTGTEMRAGFYNEEKKVVVNIHDSALGIRTDALDINESGQVVGSGREGTSDSTYLWHAFVYIPGFPILDINDLLAESNAQAELDVWKLYNGRRMGLFINGDGVIVVDVTTYRISLPKTFFVCYPVLP